MCVTWDANNLIIDSGLTARSNQVCSGTRGLVHPEETLSWRVAWSPDARWNVGLPGQSVWQVFLTCRMLERAVLCLSPSAGKNPLWEM